MKRKEIHLKLCVFELILSFFIDESKSKNELKLLIKFCYFYFNG